jgi:type IV secretory pathway VirB10-like protein
MTPQLAASLFDNPLVVAAIVIGGMIVNWLAQRKKAQEEQKQQPTSTEKPSDGFDMEETLRRLMGEEAPPPAPVPPFLPRNLPGMQPPPVEPAAATRPAQSWIEDSTISLPPPPPRPSSASFAIPQTSEQAAARFEQLNEQGRHPAKAQDLRRRHRPRGGAQNAHWHDRQKVRQAFVASLIFAPPKGLEES